MKSSLKPAPRQDKPLNAPLNPSQLIEALIGVVQQAGELILQVYARDFEVLAKADESPVTEADQLAEALLTPALQALLPGVPVVAEEAAAAGDAPAAAELGSRFWLVDPLDGTREFVQRNGEFTVNVAVPDPDESTPTNDGKSFSR